MTRKEFLVMSGIVAASAIGIIGVMKELLSQAATPTAAYEPESGTVVGAAAVVNDVTASGAKAVKFGSEPTTPSTKRLLGIYNSDGGDTQTNSLMGQYPEIASTYYQPTQQKLSIANETARINRGTAPMITLTAKGTQRLAGIANGNADDLAWLDEYVAALNTLSNVNSNVKVYATLDHEWEVKVNQAKITGESADPAIYGKALSVFFQKCKTGAPKVIYTYWVGGADSTNLLNTVLTNITVAPMIISCDPYLNNSETGTAASNWASYLDKFRSASGKYRTQYVRLGSPPLAISEHGIQTTTHTDTQVAAYFVNLRQQMADENVVFSIFFNSDADNPHMITPGGSNPVPTAVTNFATCFTQPAV